MRTPQSRLVREAMTFEPDAGRYIHIRPRQLPPGCLNRLGAIADARGVDRALARRIAVVQRNQEAA